MADDNAARKLNENAGERGPLRVRVAEHPNPIYDKFIDQMNDPEWREIFQIPADKRHLLDGSTSPVCSLLSPTMPSSSCCHD